jgi:P2 family phage contractile tail tube protein
MAGEIKGIIKYSAVYINGVNIQGAAKVTLPELEAEGEGMRTGFMDGKIMVDMGLKEMTTKFTIVNFDHNVHEHFGALGESKRLVYRIHTANHKGIANPPLTAMMDARLYKPGIGAIEPGKPAESEPEWWVDYYKLMEGDKVVHEIDPIAPKRIIYGVNQLAQAAIDLGLSAGI